MIAYFVRCLLPLILLFLMLIGTSFLLSGTTFGFISPIMMAYFLGIFAFLCTSATFLAYFNNTINNIVALIVIALAGVFLICIFAKIYSEFGLHPPEGQTISSFRTYMYFSIVTLTTLGYGDYQPKESVQLIAALQAVMGYIYLGFIVGSVHHLLSKNA